MNPPHQWVGQVSVHVAKVGNVDDSRKAFLHVAMIQGQF